MKTKAVTASALSFLVGGGLVFFSTDGGETLEKVVLAPAPITNALLLTVPPDCLAEIQATGDDPSCSLVTAWYPKRGETMFPETLVYDVNGKVVPPSLREMRLYNFEKRSVWACGGAVMPARVQDCLDELHAESPVEAPK